MRRLLSALAATLCVVAVPASGGPLDDLAALELLERVARAARELNYVGTFVYQHGDHVEASRIVHYVDGSGEYEKLETLDGPPREIIRNNDEVRCYYPEAKVVRAEKRVARRTFPAILPEQLSALTEYYEIRRGEVERIAGHDAQALVLEPKDGLRYGHKLWADVETGLLLKARMLNEKSHAVEQFTFTQLSIGTGVTRDMVRPSFNVRFPEWRLDRFANNSPSNVDSGWVVTQHPDGFRKIMEMRRTKQGSDTPIVHLVYSDGMAAVSVFIEPAAGRSGLKEGLSRQGAINIFTRMLDNQIVTVLGEAPPVTVVQMANSVSFRGR